MGPAVQTFQFSGSPFALDIWPAYARWYESFDWKVLNGNRDASRP